MAHSVVHIWRVLYPVALAVACFWLPTTRLGIAEDKPAGLPKFDEFNEKPLDGWVWDQDERLNDLVMQLQQKELALQEIDARIAKAMGKKAGNKMAENMAWRSTQRMDLNGGGPIRWDAFYGRNAENFFYHPKDPNTTYHTNTVLQQMPSTTTGGVPGNQGVPAHQRPPQFDYIYRGYEQAQARAREEAKALAEKLDAMKERRRELENDVVILWFKLAFRVIDRDDLADQPALRWAFTPKGDAGQDDVERASALTSAARVVATAMLFNEASAESEPEKSYNTISELMTKHRKSFSDSLLRLASLQPDVGDKAKPLGQFKLLASRLEDAAKSLEEGYQGWKKGDENDEEKTKFEGLRRIQDSLVQYAKLVLALNELVGVMKKDWAIEPNLDSTEFVPTWDISYVPGSVPAPMPVPSPSPKPSGDGSACDLGLEWLARHQMPDGSWSLDSTKSPDCGGRCKDPPCSISGQRICACTGLALLAFANSEHSHTNGRYAASLAKAVGYLAKRSVADNGQFKGVNSDGKTHSYDSYGQGIATLALARLYALTADKELKAPTQLALDVIQQAQSPNTGGWSYSPRADRCDTSNTGWQVAALIAGKQAGLRVSREVLQHTHKFFDSVQIDGGSGYTYLVSPPEKHLQELDSNRPASSSIGLFCRVTVGGGNWTPRRPAYKTGVDRLLAQGPTEGVYRDYYTTLAIRESDGGRWEEWKKKVSESLIATQEQEGHGKGSWPPRRGFTFESRFLGTSFALMILGMTR